VPQRTALALGLMAKGVVANVSAPEMTEDVQGALL